MQIETAIANQVKNMREADEALCRFIQDDVHALTEELSELKVVLSKLEDSRRSQMYAVRNIEEVKEKLLSFGEQAKEQEPDVLVSLIKSFVERIYIVDENDERFCHIFIKGCTGEDYDDFFRSSRYIENGTDTHAVTGKLPVCDSDECSKNTMWYLQFHVVCDKLCVSFILNVLLLMFLQLPDRKFILHQKELFVLTHR